MKRSSVILLGVLVFAIVATPLVLATNAAADHSKAGKFLIPLNIIPSINSAKHVTIPAHHILVHPVTQVPVIGQSPVKSPVDADWSCGNDDSKKGNSENKCDFDKKDSKDKSKNDTSQGNSDDSNKTKSQDSFRDNFSNDTNSGDDSYDVNVTKVLGNDDSNESIANFAVK